MPGVQDIESKLGHLNKADLLALIKRMVQLYPDLAGLIETAQSADSPPQRPPFNSEFYRRQIDEIFYTTDRNTWGSEGRAAGPLLRIVDIGNDYVKQQDYADAASLYDIIIRRILDNYDSFRWHPYEGDLDDVVEECVEGLGKCLRGEREDGAVRKQIIQALYDVHDFDSSLENDEPVMSSRVPSMLVRWTTLEERLMVATWVQEAFGLEIDWHADDVSDSENFDDFLLGLEADTIDDETFLRICRETESYDYLIERLLKRGRLEEALAEAQHVDNYDILEIADILDEQGHEAAAEHLIEERVKTSNDTRLLQWLKERYQTRKDIAGAMDMAQRLFRAYPLAATIHRYQEIRQLAQQLDRWEAVRADIMAYIQQSHNTALQIEIALDEGQVELALRLLQAERQTEDHRTGPYGSGNSNVGIDVAKAAEENHPEESIEIYQAYVETLIEWRGRENYRIACEYLSSVRRLYQKVGQGEIWIKYIAALREQHRNLPALKDELAKAKL
jgi:tetratricopeptide (TPR) repeat protein